MALFTPPSGDGNSKLDQPVSGKAEEPEEHGQRPKFYNRPSMGLQLWGPLVPAPDNRIGLWALVTVQSVAGILMLRKSRKLRASIIMKDISRVQSLNRFSKSTGARYIAPVKPGSLFLHPLLSKLGLQSQNITKSVAQWKHILLSASGLVLLLQSALEISRLLLVYDPWEEQAKCVRDKQFFNDVVKYYHEGVDPLRFKVKDATGNKTLSVDMPEVKQGVAVARAHADSQSLVTRWLGPLEYKPMSWSEFRTKLTHYVDMCEFFRQYNHKWLLSETDVASRQKELDELTKANRDTMYKIAHTPLAVPSHLLMASKNAFDQAQRGIVMDPSYDSPEEIDLHDFWAMYNPWVDLALDTSLSIKFLPTVKFPHELNAEDVVEHHGKQLQKDPNVVPGSTK